MIADVIEAMRLGRLATDYEGLVAVKAGPSGLGILNYTDLCQRVGAHNPAVWDEVTRFCRGLILDTRTWTVAAWPFSKFFNVGETAETQPEALPKESFTVFEKVDGSLGVLYRGEDGQLAVASRGSFTSDQAIRGTAMLRQLANLDEIPDNLTMVFEIVFAENNSTVKYDFDGLVLLAIFNRETGEELAWSEVENLAGRLGCRLPKVYQFGSLAELLRGRDDLGSNVEGFVVLFASGLRAKLKGEWYLDHHRQAWGLSEKTVLEALATGKIAELLAKVPDDLQAEANRLVAIVQSRAAAVETEAEGYFAAAPKGDDRKVFAQWVRNLQNVPAAFWAVLFQLRDGREVNWYKMLP